MDLVEKTSHAAISKAFFRRPCPNGSVCHFGVLTAFSFHKLAGTNTGVALLARRILMRGSLLTLGPYDSAVMV